MIARLHATAKSLENALICLGEGCLLLLLVEFTHGLNHAERVPCQMHKQPQETKVSDGLRTIHRIDKSNKHEQKTMIPRTAVNSNYSPTSAIKDRYIQRRFPLAVKLVLCAVDVQLVSAGEEGVLAGGGQTHHRASLHAHARSC